MSDTSTATRAAMLLNECEKEWKSDLRGISGQICVPADAPSGIISSFGRLHQYHNTSDIRGNVLLCF